MNSANYLPRGYDRINELVARKTGQDQINTCVKWLGMYAYRVNCQPKINVIIINLCSVSILKNPSSAQPSLKFMNRVAQVVTSDRARDRPVEMNRVAQVVTSDRTRDRPVEMNRVAQVVTSDRTRDRPVEMNRVAQVVTSDRARDRPVEMQFRINMSSTEVRRQTSLR